MPRDAMIVPLKRFDVAKERLRRAGTTDVSALAQELADRVIGECAPRHVIVLSESDDITQFATQRGAEVRRSNARDLNEAVQGAYDALSERFDRLFIVHGDLRLPVGLGTFEPTSDVTIVTDHHATGTNVLVVPTGAGFQFAYGPGSAARHESEARRLGLGVVVHTDSPWRYDVDEPGDLEILPEQHERGPGGPLSS